MRREGKSQSAGRRSVANIPTLEGVVRAGGLVLVRVQLQGQLAVAALQVVLATALGAAQHLVVVLLDEDLAHQLALLCRAGVLSTSADQSAMTAALQAVSMM